MSPVAAVNQLRGRTSVPSRPALRLFAGLLPVLALIVLLWDWNWVRRPIEYRVEAMTGRSFSIGGDLDVDLGWQPRIRVERIRFGNPEWARTPLMFGAEQADFTIDLRELFGGRLLLPHVALIQPVLDLERSLAGQDNWQLARPADKPAGSRGEKGLPQIGSLRVEHGRVLYLDPASNTDLHADVATRTIDEKPELVVKARGRLRSLDAEGDAVGGLVLALADLETPYPLRANLRIGGTRLSISGSLSGLPTVSAARLHLEVTGDSAAQVNPLLGLALPDTPPYRLAGELLRDDAETWTFRDFQGRLGDSDLAGDLTLRYTEGRARMVADLRSRQLDLDDLSGFIGATPDTGPGETSSAQQEIQARRDDAKPRVLPDRPLNLVRLRGMDADVRYSALSLRNKKAPIDNLQAHLLLDRGLLRLEPLNFGVAGGEITSTLQVDAREDVPALGASIDFKRLDLTRLMPSNSRIAASAGTIGGRAELRGRGTSTAALLGSANGTLGIAMRDGRFSNLLVEGLGLDAAEALRFLVGGDRRIRLRCAVADLEAKDGVLTPRSFVIDTTDTKILLQGQLSLRDETLDLNLHALPKDWSPMSLRSPLHLRGTLKNPTVRVDKALALRGGVAALLGALVNPLAALLPLIETGPGRNADCEELIAAVHAHTPAIPGAGAAR